MTVTQPALSSGRPSTRPGRARGATRIARTGLAAVLLVLAQVLPSAGSAVAANRRVDAIPAGDGARSAADSTTQLQPGIQYEEALAHASDRIAFTAGDRVTVGFRPRPGDSWPVDGHTPRGLPAGSESGREIRAGTGSGSGMNGPADAVSSATPNADPALATTDNPSDPLSLDGTRLRRQVFGFLPYWEVNSASLDYETLSTIAYFSVGSDRAGNLLKTNSDGSTTTGWSGWTSARMTSIINAAHTKGTRVVLTISMFAWTTTQATTQGAFLADATARLNLARQAAAAVRARGADGINLDFEPIASGHADEFTAFVRTVRAELSKQSAGYQLTFDTTGSIGNYPLEAATAAGGADAIFIMGYDYRTSGTGYVGSIDPLAGPAYDLADTVAAYSARVPASRLILGVPWYGRAWSTVSNVVNARNQSGTQFGASTSVVYDTAVDVAAQYGRRWDSRELTPWVAYQRQNCTTTYGCVMSWRQLYYDDATSLKLRYDLVNRKGLRGVGIWALGYDGTRTEMRQALAEKFLNDRTVPLAGIRNLEPSQATESFSVAWAGSDESGILDYDVQVSIDGGPWNDWLIDATAASASYMGASGHGFAFRARARDTHLNVSAWDVVSVYRPHVALSVGGFGEVVASSVNVRSAAGTAASVVTTAASGTILAITGGPVSADGFTWWNVSLPIAEWAPVSGVRTDVWVAAGDATSTFVAAVGAPNSTAVGGVTAPGARFVGIDPVRLLDNRVGTGLSGMFSSGAARTFPVAGRGGIPSNAVAVSGTVTVAGQTSAGYLGLGPSTATVVRSSVVNIPFRDVRASGVTIMLGADGSLAAKWMGLGGSRANVIFDATGYFVPGAAGATFMPLVPARILDTRIAKGLSGSFVSNTPRSFAVGGAGGVPAGAVAVTGNLTIVGETSSGHAYVGPTAAASPASSTLNLPRGDIRSASVTVKLDGAGHLAAVWVGTAGSRAHLLFDVTGYFVNTAGGAEYYPLDAARVLDTRTPNGLSGPFLRNAARTFQASGRGTVPVDAVAVTGSATVVTPTVSGFLIVGPSAGSLGTTSTINVPRGDIRSNGLTVRTGAGGSLAAVYSGATGASANVLFAIFGYFR